MSRVRISSSALQKPASMAGFNVLKYIGDKHGDELAALKKRYKEPTINTTGKKWYVEFYYLIPVKLRPKYGNKVWERFKVYKNINRIKTLEYARQLRDAVELALEDGLDPFKPDEVLLNEAIETTAAKKTWTCNQAILYFTQKWAERGLQPSSLRKYELTAERLIAWLKLVDLINKPASVLTSDHIEAELTYYKAKNGWKNRTYNNEKDFLTTLFSFLKKKKIITDKPTDDIDEQKASTKKHRYYDKKLFEDIREIMQREDPYLHLVADIVYSTCIRSEKELRNLKVKSIIADTGQIFITAGGSKNNEDRYVPMPARLMQRFKELGILKAPREFYIFGQDGKPAAEPVGREFFARRFRKIRTKLELSGDYTLYGFKHTRVVHMKKDGAKDDEIMAVTGHRDFTSYTKYLRDLGLDVDTAAIEQKTRDF
jgi:site-specific recombinase XerD